MRFDNGAADRQAHPQAARLCREERVKDALETRWSQSWTRIPYRDKHPIRLSLSSADDQFPRPLADRAQCFDSVDDQVEDHLLQLDPISANKWQALRALRLHRDAVLRDFATGQADDLEDRFVDVHVFFMERCFFEKRAHPADDLADSIAVSKDTIERLPGLLQIWRFFAQPAQRGSGIVDRCCDRLVDFMGNRGRELPHRRDAIRMRQLHLCLVVAPLALAQAFLGTFAFGQIEHECEALVTFFLEHRGANKHRNAAAVFPKIFLLEGLNYAG